MSLNALENLVDRLAALPGIGRKSAKRLAYYIINMPQADSDNLVYAISLAKKSIQKCKICGNYSEMRDHSKLMIVQNPKDVDSFENSNCYDGLYFVLDEEHLDPLKGIGPEEMGFGRLKTRLVQDDGINEVILALNSNVESEQTGLLLKALVEESGKKVTKISQGIPAGGVLEYFDSATIRQAFENRREA